jgi:acyl-CoA-binding protein
MKAWQNSRVAVADDRQVNKSNNLNQFLQEEPMSLDDDFEKAIQDAQGLPEKPSNQELLLLYGLFKQSNVGDASGKRPPLHDMFGRAKFDAWTKLKGTSNDEAKQQYIDAVAAMLKAHQ